MGEVGMRKILLIGLIGVLTSCMQLSEVEVCPDGPCPTGNTSQGGSGNPKLKMDKRRLTNKGISYYEAILICNEKSKEEGLDTLYQYDEPRLTGGLYIWLPNIKVLKDRSGYRLPTKEEWIQANENDEMEDIDEDIGEWLYKENNKEYTLFELAPKFLSSVGLYGKGDKYSIYGMRVLKVN
jgi:hypothetical protein